MYKYISKSNINIVITILLIVLLGLFLRFFNILDNIKFHAEIGQDYLQIKNNILNKEIPLIGPSTQHPWIFLGPLFFWIMIPFFIWENFNPLVGSYFFTIYSLLIIIENYIFLKKISNIKIALLSSSIVSLSPIWLIQTHDSRFYFLTILFFYPYLFFFIKVLREKTKDIFWVFFFLAIMLNFHLSVLILFPPTIFLIFFYKIKLTKGNILKTFLGILLPSFPFLIVNIQQHFQPMIKMAMWIPYRIAGFFGLYPKNSVTGTVLFQNMISLFDIFLKQIVGYSNPILLFLSAAFIGFLGWVFYQKIKARNFDNIFILSVIFIFGYLALFIHGNPPLHYFIPLYAIPPILIAYVCDQYLGKFGWKMIYIFIVSLFIINVPYYFSTAWFYLPENVPAGYVRYSKQLEIAKVITADAKGQPYELHRRGAFDNYEGDYAQNYQYLLWLDGNEPVPHSNIVYTIYESPPPVNSLNDKNLKVIPVEDITIIKQENGIQ